jgi:hypothetical protein
MAVAGEQCTDAGAAADGQQAVANGQASANFDTATISAYQAALETWAESDGTAWSRYVADTTAAQGSLLESLDAASVANAADTAAASSAAVTANAAAQRAFIAGQTSAALAFSSAESSAQLQGDQEVRAAIEQNMEALINDSAQDQQATLAADDTLQQQETVQAQAVRDATSLAQYNYDSGVNQLNYNVAIGNLSSADTTSLSAARLATIDGAIINSGSQLAQNTLDCTTATIQATLAQAQSDATANRTLAQAQKNGELELVQSQSDALKQFQNAEASQSAELAIATAAATRDQTKAGDAATKAQSDATAAAVDSFENASAAVQNA